MEQYGLKAPPLYFYLDDLTIEAFYLPDWMTVFGAGPWAGEPVTAIWKSPVTGNPCWARRNHLGAWCGYVAVLPGHPCHGRPMDELDELLGGMVHGGVTYAGPGPGEAEFCWAIGFDCAHYGDLVPRFSQAGVASEGDVYRDFRFVVDEVRRLDARLAQIAGGQIAGGAGEEQAQK